MIKLLLPLGLAGLLGFASVAQAQSVEGHFRFKENRGEYAGGVAVRWADPDNPGQSLVGVVLSNQTLDASRGAGASNPLDAITQGLDWDQGYLQLKLSGSDAELKFDHVYFMPGSFNTSGNGEEQVRVENGRVIGSWKLPPQDFFDDTYEADIRFDLPLVELKDPGQPLPAGGGDPGRAYTAYIAAVAKGDVEGIKAAITEGNSWRFSWLEDDNAKARALEDEALHKPVRVTIGGGWVEGDRAMLKVEGPGRFGGSYAGRVMMEREGGAWKVASQELR